MDAARAAMMSDPERNGFFRRRWSEPVLENPRPIVEQSKSAPLEMTGRDLLPLWRHKTVQGGRWQR